MDVEKASLCNCVVNFLLEENYLLSAFELLHELLDDGRDAHAIRLKEFFENPSQFPPDQISRFNSLRVADPQTLLEEKETLVEKLAIAEYELRLAQEDATKLKGELQKKTDITPRSPSEASANYEPNPELRKSDSSFSELGPLKEHERRDLNCAVKEYLLLAGYRLTAMTFYEEVTDQNLDVWSKSSACVPDALRHYYYQYLSSTAEAAEEKIAILREHESLQKEIDRLKSEKQASIKYKDLADGQVMALTKSLETLQNSIKEKEILVKDLKQSLDHQRKELNDYRAETTSLKMHIERTQSGQFLVQSNVEQVESLSLESYKEQLEALQKEIEQLKAATSVPNFVIPVSHKDERTEANDDVVKLPERDATKSSDQVLGGSLEREDNQSVSLDMSPGISIAPKKVSEEPAISSLYESSLTKEVKNTPKYNAGSPRDENGLLLKTDSLGEANIEKMGLLTIQILSDALPKIVPYVLINHREELLPLIMCAIERHPDSSTRDSLTHTLFNLIKRPDEKQRRIIMDGCVTLAKDVGEMRTETELLPQCWEQINHKYEERRLLVAQSCGELARFVRPEIRDSLILSIVQQLIEDSATVVREAAARNLTLLLPLFPTMDKYYKVEELMFQLVCDPSGVVVETTIRELVPALLSWANRLDNMLRVLMSNILSSAQRCPPVSGVEGSLESYLRVLGERERWTVDVLLRLLAELLPNLHQKSIETCPFPSASDVAGTLFSTSLLELYAGGHVEWPTFELLHCDCFPTLIQLASLLPQKEDKLRSRITKLLLTVSKLFGDDYVTNIMLPVFLIAVGDKADLTFIPNRIQTRIKGLRPKSSVAERLATMCVLPILLAGVLGSPSKHENLTEYLRNLLVQNAVQENQSVRRNAEIVNSVRFLCSFEEHHNMVFNILWEMVVSSNIYMKISAANLWKAIVPYIDVKVASTHVLPALVTLGSDQNLNVKYASIEAFGAVAQHFKNDTIIEKIRVQMDAFLEDGSHETAIAVVRALVVAVPNSTDRFRDYILKISRICVLSAAPIPSSDVVRRRDRANAFCECIRAVDATELPATSVRDYLLPTIQNLLKDSDALDPAHKEALEIIVRERSGGSLDTFSKVMGAHLGITSLFGEGGLLGKKESGDLSAMADQLTEASKPIPAAPDPAQTADDTRFRRIMRGGFTDILRGKTEQ
ncbi:hypothetical protein DCAR_0729754 [Daucus carota subsp. sativus]|uniref:LisH domain-containing protein n=1 Tax=Daucus carota subsp. sativus TaxID=79200 RepID=A0AAF0XNH3_DAUCS|nr:hypothetical protein DCAR_0729754 [Daucus carota subsp. sativus]